MIETLWDSFPPPSSFARQSVIRQQASGGHPMPTLLGSCTQPFKVRQINQPALL